MRDAREKRNSLTTENTENSRSKFDAETAEIAQRPKNNIKPSSEVPRCSNPALLYWGVNYGCPSRLLRVPVLNNQKKR